MISNTPHHLPNPTLPFPPHQQVLSKEDGSAYYTINEVSSVDDPTSRLSVTLIGVKVAATSQKLSFKGEVSEGVPGRQFRGGGHPSMGAIPDPAPLPSTHFSSVTGPTTKTRSTVAGCIRQRSREKAKVGFRCAFLREGEL